MKNLTIQEINAVLNGVVVGTTSHTISAPEQLELAKETEISFIGHKKYEKYWETSKACAAIVNEDIAIEPGDNKVFIKHISHENKYSYFIKGNLLLTNCLQKLRILDAVAYVRFASVYREFKDISEFIDELKPLMTGVKKKKTDGGSNSRNISLQH